MMIGVNDVSTVLKHEFADSRYKSTLIGRMEKEDGCRFLRHLLTIHDCTLTPSRLAPGGHKMLAHRRDNKKKAAA